MRPRCRAVEGCTCTACSARLVRAGGGPQYGQHDRTRLLVMNKRCAECLFSAGRIVSEERVADILADVERRDTHFVCHKSTLRGDRGVMCRGDWDRNSDRTLVMRLAKFLGVVEFVSEAES